MRLVQTADGAITHTIDTQIVARFDRPTSELQQKESILATLPMDVQVTLAG